MLAKLGLTTGQVLWKWCHKCELAHLFVQKSRPTLLLKCITAKHFNINFGLYSCVVSVK